MVYCVEVDVESTLHTVWGLYTHSIEVHIHTKSLKDHSGEWLTVGTSSD